MWALRAWPHDSETPVTHCFNAQPHCVLLWIWDSVFLCDLKCTVWSVECSTYTTFHWPSTSLLQYKGPWRERWRWMWWGKLMWRWGGMVRGMGILKFVSLVKSYWKIRHKGETEFCDVWKVAPIIFLKSAMCPVSHVTICVLRVTCHPSHITNASSHSHGPFRLLIPPLCTTGCFAKTQKSTFYCGGDILDNF